MIPVKPYTKNHDRLSERVEQLKGVIIRSERYGNVAKEQIARLKKIVSNMEEIIESKSAF